MSIFVMFLLLFASILCHAQTATCTDWKFFPSGQPYGINRWGTVVGASNTGPFAYIRYSNGAVKKYMAPNASRTLFTRRNKLGVNVGFYDSHGLVVSGSNAVTVDYPGAAYTELWGINYRGTMVGSSSEGGFQLKNGVFTSINVPGTTDTTPRSISDKGVIVGIYQSTSPYPFEHGLSLENGVYTTLDNPKGSSLQGTIVPEYNHGFILENGVYTTLDNPKSIVQYGTFLTDINGSGAIVGVYSNSSTSINSFIYINGIFKDIAPPNTDTAIVLGINGFGDVTGSTHFNSGGYASFTAHCE